MVKKMINTIHLNASKGFIRVLDVETYLNQDVMIFIRKYKN